MADMNRNEFVMQALTELAPEVRAARGGLRAVRPALREAIADFLPLPPQTVFLGVATDGLPVLLSLRDAVAGPMLIAGDAGSGKTELLKVIARGVDQTQDARRVQYGVITEHPDEWEELGSSPSQVGIFPLFQTGAQEFLESLDEWAHTNRGDRQSVLLLIDDLSAVVNLDDEARHSLRWLLLRGPARRVWPIVTVHPRHVPAIHPWISFFHTRLFGRIADPRDVGDLAGGSNPRLETLGAGSEFTMREGNDWVKFWIPGI